MAQLLDLPTELQIKILNNLDLRTLMQCKTLSQYFNSIITDDITLKYKLELELCGMEDGPPSGMVPHERFQCLQEHQTAWSKLQFSLSTTVKMEKGSVWELYGNVLAQGKGKRSLVFYQIPSPIRGIESKTWTVQVDEAIRDFAMDPTEELLIIVERSSANPHVERIHLRTISEGKAHPASTKSALLEYQNPSHSNSYMIQPSGDLLGIVFETHDKNHLVVWNWKTGERLLAVYGEPVHAFMFLSEHHIAIAKVHENDISLLVVDLRSSSRDPTDLNDVEFECEFLFPILSAGYRVWDVIFRSDPAPGWTPSPTLRVPFHVSRKDRLFIITVTARNRDRFRAYTVFFPTSTLLRAMDTYAGVVEWDQWGPTGTRLISPTFPVSQNWVCYVYGLRYAVFVPGFPENRGTDKLYIFDFNQLAIRKAKQELEGGEGGDGTWVLMMEPSINRHDNYSLFDETVETTLPLRYMVLELEHDTPSHTTAAMISEDAVVLVGDIDDDDGSRQYHILTF